jgi:hypothetical protein
VWCFSFNKTHIIFVNFAHYDYEGVHTKIYIIIIKTKYKYLILILLFFSCLQKMTLHNERSRLQTEKKAGREQLTEQQTTLLHKYKYIK